MKAVERVKSVTLSERSVALLQFQLVKLEALEAEYVLLVDSGWHEGGPCPDSLLAAWDRVDRMRGVVISDLRKFIEMECSQCAT